MLGLLVLALHRALPVLFTQDPLVRQALAAALVVVAVQQPLSGFVFVLDGVLIGAGDGRWLAVAAIVQLVLYLPVVVLMQQADVAAAGLWWGFAVFMLARGVLLGWRARSDRWTVTGAAR